MLLIRPIKILPGMITGSNAGAPDRDYDPDTIYALGERVYYPDNGKTYECVQAPAQGQNPATAPLYWMPATPSNRWSMYDTEIGTATTTPGDLVTTFAAPGRINAVALFGLQGSRLLLTQRGADGAILTQFEKELRIQPTNWHEYFFAEPEQVTEAVFTGLHPASDSSISIDITGPAACAAIVAGSAFDLGAAQWGASTSIIDYSRKTTTAEGVQSFEPGRFSRRMSVQLEQPRQRYPAVQRALEAVRATPCVWLGVPGDADYSPMTIYGYYRDFSVEVTYATTHICSLEIESLT